MQMYREYKHEGIWDDMKNRQSSMEELQGHSDHDGAWTMSEACSLHWLQKQAPFQIPWMHAVKESRSEALTVEMWEDHAHCKTKGDAHNY